MPELPLETLWKCIAEGHSDHFETGHWSKTRRGQIRHFNRNKKQGGYSSKAAWI